MLLDDSEVVLGPGDVLVQRGTNHACSDRGIMPVKIAFILIDGAYEEELQGLRGHKQV